MNKLETEQTIYRMMSTMLHDACASIPDTEFHVIPPGGGNSPNWIVGHLVVVNLMGANLLGHPDPLLAEMMGQYGPGSVPTEDRSQLRDKADLCSHYESTAAKFLGAISGTSVDTLDSPQATPFFQQQLPSHRELLAHLLTSHLSLHVGQLTAWRRSRGYDSLLQFN